MRHRIVAWFRGLSVAAVALGSDRRGVTMLEYSLIGALIAALSVVAVTSLGTSVSTMFGNVSASIEGHH